MMKRIYYNAIWWTNTQIGNLFWPGLGKHAGSLRYEIAMSFWSRAYGYGQVALELERGGEVGR